MKKASSILWGVLLVAVGILFALNALEITDFDLFFDGWWTLFIIVPCFIGLFTDREKTGNLIGILIGALLLLTCRGVLDWNTLWKLAVPAVIIIIGLRMVFHGFFGNKASEMIAVMKASGATPRVGCAAFSGCNMNFDGEVFDGAELTATFGGVKCDLRSAILEKDCAIKATAVFGGIDILVPPHVNVSVSSTSIFGGISNKTAPKKDAVTIWVSGTCMFGGVDIK